MSDTSWTPNFGGIGVNAPPWPAKRPVRIALLGDFSAGALSGRLETGELLAQRKPLRVECDTLEDALSRLGLKLTLPIGAGGSAVEVAITELESFHPDELYRNLELFSALSGLRKRLNTPATFAKAAEEVRSWGGGGERKASSLSINTRSPGAELSPGASQDDFARLVGRPSAAQAAGGTIDRLLRDIVGPFIVPASSPDKDALIASVDKALSDAMSAVLHQPDFQNAESLWRGADFLLRRLETGHQLQVHLIDISAEELAADLSGVDDLAESGLYKLLVEQPSRDADGGYSYLAGCYRFDATPPQIELLGRMALVAAHAGAPFIAAIDTDAFTDRKEPPHRLVRTALEALRELPDASFLGLIGPRFLLRNPYGKRSDPITSFKFEEFSLQAGLRGMLWGHPALLALSVLCVRGAQLTIGDLAFHHYVDADGDSVALPCTDRMINTNASALLRDFGINGVMAHKGEAMVRLTGLEALNGDGLAQPGGMARKPASDTRFMLRSKPRRETATAPGWAPAERRAAGGSATRADAPADAEEAVSGEAVPEEAIPEEDVQDPTAATGTAPAAEAASVEAASADDELAALLASLESPAPEPAAQASPAAGEEEMDPDLAALLKSLG